MSLGLSIWFHNTAMNTGVRVQQRKCLAASQLANLYYALKVCSLFVKKRYILLSMKQNSRQALGYTWLRESCNCLNCLVTHLVTVNIIHISFNFISYRIGEK